MKKIKDLKKIKDEKPPKDPPPQLTEAELDALLEQAVMDDLTAILVETDAFPQTLRDLCIAEGFAVEDMPRRTRISWVYVEE